MKLKWKQALSALLAIALMLSFAGCAKGTDNTASSSDATASDAAYTDDELAQIAVKVGDEYTITKGDILDEYDYMVQMYTYYGMSAPTTDEDIEAMQDSVIASLVSDKIQLYQTKQMGITLTDEQQADAEAQTEEQIQYYLDSFRDQATSEGATDVEARALEIFQEQLDASNMDMDMDGFRAYVLENLENTALKDALKAKVTEGVTATDEEVQTYFDTLLSTQTETYTTTPADYLSAAEDFQMNGGDPMLFTPEGYVRVRSITISPEGDVSADYTTLKTDMDTIASQYGVAALDALAAKYSASGADTSSATIATSEIDGGAALVSDYLTKKAAADALYEEYIKDARTKANEAYAALQSGTSFADAMTQYGEDTMYTQYPSFVDSGLLMYIGGEDTVWDSKLVDAVKLLKDGETTGIIQIDDMFYILQLVGPEAAGTKTLADVLDTVKAQVIATAADKLWNETLEKWSNDTTLATYYEDVYRDIGK